MRPSAKHKQYLTEVCHRHARSIPDPRILCPLSACFASLSSFDTVAVERGHLFQHPDDCSRWCMQSRLRLILVRTHWGVLIVVLLALLYFCMTQRARLLALCPFQAANWRVWRDDRSKGFGEIHFRTIPYFAEKNWPPARWSSCPLSPSRFCSCGRFNLASVSEDVKHAVNKILAMKTRHKKTTFQGVMPKPHQAESINQTKT